MAAGAAGAVHAAKHHHDHDHGGHHPGGETPGVSVDGGANVESEYELFFAKNWAKKGVRGKNRAIGPGINSCAKIKHVIFIMSWEEYNYACFRAAAVVKHAVYSAQ